MAKNEKSLKQLKIEVFTKEMARVGFNPKAFSKKEIEFLALGAFKDATSKKSFGAIYTIKNNELVAEKVAGQIRKRQREQIASFKITGVFEEPRSFGQQIAAQSINAAMGYDVFGFIRDNQIVEYDISDLSYVDPLSGELKSFIGTMV